MTPAERTAKIAELRAEADRLEMEGKRNWPEKVEKGMLFAWGSIKYILSPTANLDEFVLVNLEDGNRHANPSKDPFYYGTANYTYLGHARDLLAIKTPDAPEPTGAELVWRKCWFRGYNLGQDDPEKWVGPWKCVNFDSDDPNAAFRTDEIGKLTGWYKEARLYREDRP